MGEIAFGVAFILFALCCATAMVPIRSDEE